MIILIFFAFISGIMTIFAPFIWPLLPMLLSSSISGSHRKAIGITLGIVISFSILTLIFIYLSTFFNLQPNFFKIIASVAIAFLGFTLIIPVLLTHYELLISRVSSFIGGQTLSKHHGFIGGVITGLSLGIIWLPCVAPIFTTIAALPSNKIFGIEIIFIVLTFSIGVGVPFLLISLLGTLFIKENKFIAKYNNFIQKIFGVIMIITAIAIYTNYDRIIQNYIFNSFSGYVNLVKKV